MIHQDALRLLFSGSCLWRWNDKLRPAQLTEIEKQAHKALVAFALWHETSASPEAKIALAGKIIEGALFDYFFRLIITDIKPPLFYRIKANKERYRTLTEYALKELEPTLAPLGEFWTRMRAWLTREDAEKERDRRILAAAHLYASRWEFLLIRPHNAFDEEMDGIGRTFEEELETFKDLPAMPALLNPENGLGKFANFCGRLRFQIRWTQTCLSPAPSVLGHVFVMAAAAYLYSLKVGASQERANNNFFAGLLHDFPELLTRDIISPVKQSVSGLSGLIREYEGAEMERRVFGPLREAGFGALTEKMGYYLGAEIGSEFRECYRDGGRVIAVDGLEALSRVDKNGVDAKDGELLKACDLLAAYLEADASARNGVSSPQLLGGMERIKKRLLATPKILGMDELMAEFS